MARDGTYLRDMPALINVSWAAHGVARLMVCVFVLEKQSHGHDSGIKPCPLTSKVCSVWPHDLVWVRGWLKFIAFQPRDNPQ